MGIYLLFASGVIGPFLILAGITITAAVLGTEGTLGGPLWGMATDKYRERRAKDR